MISKIPSCGVEPCSQKYHSLPSYTLFINTMEIWDKILSQIIDALSWVNRAFLKSSFTSSKNAIHTHAPFCLCPTVSLSHTRASMPYCVTVTHTRFFSLYVYRARYTQTDTNTHYTATQANFHVRNSKPSLSLYLSLLLSIYFYI